MVRIPFSQRIGFATVVESTLSRHTGSFDRAMRPAKPTPTGTRTPWRTSSSMPHAARATRSTESLSRSSTAAVSASRMPRTRSNSSMSKFSTSKRPSLVSVTARKLAN